MDKRIKKDASTQDPDYRMWVLLGQVMDMAMEAREYEMEQYGATAIQAGVMFIIEAAGGSASQTEIAKWMLRKPSSISGILGRMEKAGLVTKGMDPVRKGLTKVVLTYKGKQIYKQSLKRETIHNIIGRLPKEEYNQLWQILEKLRDATIEETGKRRPIPFP